jgi:serine/threonine protein phosphatase PrpC
MTEAALRIEAMAQSDVGRVREVNEDCYCALPHARLFAVADGMGGHARGDWASACIAEAIADCDTPEDFDEAVAAVAGAIHAANRTIYEEARAQGVQMGSTVVATVFRERRFAVLWAGDSRAYLCRQGRLHRLTRDHTQVQDLVDSGMLAADQAADHPMAHVLSRAVGVGQELQLDAVADAAEPGDLFLLCSDGLYGVVDDAEIASMMADPAIHGDPNQMIALALARGAPDNVTVVTISAAEPTLLVFAAEGNQAA